ncbi:uncharacterized protein LOC132284485 [Cornus florida]|uniref:uncharacterized protein LOC132284485 n=1 Tax=Cornus florida TaxID=4283 RepID=UPI00289C80CA|nr:uncharacterized protein LOC132284485 [Cornus florida]XP_059642579.1 uncharacterized protein LOC132284485 [Cornus florida]XP_059642580.1 uncharacterized protein LOC132284485 [Cornus florida]
MEGKGTVWWNASDRPDDFGYYYNGIGDFKNTGQVVEVSAIRYKATKKREANQLVRRLRSSEHKNVAKILYRKNHKKSGGTTIVVERLGLDFYNWVYQPNLDLWEVDSKNVVFGAGKDFLKVFKEIIKGLDYFVQTTGYHGNLINGVTVSSNKEVRLFWPSKIKRNPVEALRKDIQDLADLVTLAVAAQSKVTFEEAQTSKVGLIVCVNLFLDLIANVLPICQTLDELKKFWGFVKMNPIFQDAEQRYEMQIIFNDVHSKISMEVFEKVTLCSAATEIEGWWYTRIPSDSFLKGIGSKRPLVQVKGTEKWVLRGYDMPNAIFDFHVNAYECAREGKTRKTPMEVSEELFKIFPDYGPKYFHELVLAVYKPQNRTTDANTLLSELTSRIDPLD